MENSHVNFKDSLIVMYIQNKRKRLLSWIRSTTIIGKLTIEKMKKIEHKILVYGENNYREKILS